MNKLYPLNSLNRYLFCPTLPLKVEAAIALNLWDKDLSLEVDRAIVQAETRWLLDEFKGVQS